MPSGHQDEFLSDSVEKGWKFSGNINSRNEPQFVSMRTLFRLKVSFLFFCTHYVFLLIFIFITNFKYYTVIYQACFFPQNRGIYSIYRAKGRNASQSPRILYFRKIFVCEYIFIFDSLKIFTCYQTCIISYESITKYWQANVHSQIHARELHIIM